MVIGSGRDKNGQRGSGKLLIWKNQYTNQYGGVLCALGDAPEGRIRAYQEASEAKAQRKG